MTGTVLTNAPDEPPVGVRHGPLGAPGWIGAPGSLSVRSVGSPVDRVLPHGRSGPGNAELPGTPDDAGPREFPAYEEWAQPAGMSTLSITNTVALVVGMLPHRVVAGALLPAPLNVGALAEPATVTLPPANGVILPAATRPSAS